MSLLSQAINNLKKEARTNYRVVFQLVLPKWLEELYVFGISYKDDFKKKTPKQYTADQIQIVVNAKDANVKLIHLEINRNKIFWCNQTPQGLKRLNLESNKTTSFDTKILPARLKDWNLTYNKLPKS